MKEKKITYYCPKRHVPLKIQCLQTLFIIGVINMLLTPIILEAILSMLKMLKIQNISIPNLLQIL